MKYAIILSPEAIEDLRRLKAPIRSQVKEGIEIHLQGEKMGSHLIIRFRCKTPGFESGENPCGERFFSGWSFFFD
jgi:mRNA-degrading endonuclease RelE of RelBE toxin-antitoxin system